MFPSICPNSVADTRLNSQASTNVKTPRQIFEKLRGSIDELATLLSTIKLKKPWRQNSTSTVQVIPESEENKIQKRKITRIIQERQDKKKLASTGSRDFGETLFDHKGPKGPNGPIKSKRSLLAGPKTQSFTNSTIGNKSDTTKDSRNGKK